MVGRAICKVIKKWYGLEKNNGCLFKPSRGGTKFT